jgi:hydroxypyruvate reductase
LPAKSDLLFLISGGASSLIEYLPPGVALGQLQQVNQWLLGSGIDITEMNLVRKSISLIKAGGVLDWLGDRRVFALAISDVPGDDPAVIGSGLLSNDLDLARKVRHLELPDWIKTLIEQGLENRRAVSRKDNLEIHLVARLADAMQAAALAGRAMGYSVHLDDTFQSGDAGEKGRQLARTLRAGESVLYVWGGETTVSLPKKPGLGGRNQHLAVSAAIELAGDGQCCFLSAGTDGTDGPGTNAGALVDGATFARGTAAGLDAMDCLRRADSGRFLAASGDLIHTGPTGTNVMDIMLGLKQ